MSLKFTKTETPLAYVLHGKNIAAFIEVAPKLPVANAIIV